MTWFNHSRGLTPHSLQELSNEQMTAVFLAAS